MMEVSRPLQPQNIRPDSKPEDGYDEEPDLLSKWSSFYYRQRQSDILENFRSIWPWFFESEQYKNWKEGRRWRLHCHSEPGCGKTHLAAEAARQLQDQEKYARIAVIILYLGHRNPEGEIIYTLPDPVAALWRTVMRQILEILLLQRRTQEILGFFSLQELESQNLPLDLLQRRVNTILNRLFDQVFIVVDDLDHCPPTLQAEFKVEFDRMLEKTRDDLKTGVLTVGQFRMPSTSSIDEGTDTESAERADNKNRQRNQNCDVESCEDPERPVLYWRCQTCLEAGVEFDVCQSCYHDGMRCKESHDVFVEPYDEVSVQLTVTEAEMREFVRYKIEDACENSQLRRRLTDHLKDAVESNTVNTASGSLVIAQTYVDHLFRSENHEELLGVLDHVAQPEKRYFDSMLQKVEKQDIRNPLLAYQVLYLVSQASHETPNRRLDFDEILDALAIWNSDSDNADDKLTLNEMLAICQGILTILPGDKNLIQAFHGDMEIYLYENELECFEDFDIGMTELCLEALSADTELATFDLRDDATGQSLLSQHPFLLYASQCWGYHLAQNSTDESEESAHALLRDGPRLAASLYIACTSPLDGARVFDIWPGSHPLHVCAYFNLIEQLDLFISETPEIDPDVREPAHSRTPLIVACQYGNTGIARELLSRGANPDLLSRTRRSAVYEAVDQDFPKIVQLFIDAKNWSALNQKSQCGRTPLILSMMKGGGGRIFQMLAAQDEIDINMQDDDGKTALMYAVMKEDVDAIDILLQRKDIELHHRDGAGQTVMHIAASQANYEIQRKLFSFAGCASLTEILNTKDVTETTVLMAIVDLMDDQDDDEESAQEIPQIAEMLIKSGSRVDCTDNVGRGLLHHACMNDAQLPLLEQLHKAGLSPNAGDNHGWTPLHSASAHAASATVDRLLELGAEPLRTDMPSSFLPSDIAALYGHDALASRLKSFEQAQHQNQQQQPALPSNPLDPSTPLWSLILNSPSSSPLPPFSSLTDKSLLAQDPHLHDTALHKAVRSHDPDIVRALLSDSRVPLEARNCWSETALHLAARGTSAEALEVLEALLEGGADTRARDVWGRTALGIALEKDQGSEGVMALLEHAEKGREGKGSEGEEEGEEEKRVGSGGGEDLQIMLDAAIRGRRRKVVERLLRAGASLLKHDERGLLPVHVVEEVRGDGGFVEWVRGRYLEAVEGVWQREG